MKQNSDCSWGNEQVLYRDNYKYEIIDVNKPKSAFSNRCPRKDSKYATYHYLVWNLRENHRVGYELC